MMNLITIINVADTEVLFISSITSLSTLKTNIISLCGRTKLVQAFPSMLHFVSGVSGYEY